MAENVYCIADLLTSASRVAVTVGDGAVGCVKFHAGITAMTAQESNSEALARLFGKIEPVISISFSLDKQTVL